MKFFFTFMLMFTDDLSLLCPDMIPLGSAAKRETMTKTYISLFKGTLFIKFASIASYLYSM